MTTFYGVTLETPCSRPPDISEIKSMSDNVQEWLLGELVKWVRDNGGELSSLLADTHDPYTKRYIHDTWYEPAQAPELVGTVPVVADLTETARQLHVGLQ